MVDQRRRTRSVSEVVDLKRKVAVVTGASSGLGRRLALDLTRYGAVVIGLARRESLLDSLRTEMQGHSPHSSTVVCDVTDIDLFTQTLREIETGLGPIEVLVNNAGIDDPHADAEDLGTYRSKMETNYFAAVAGTLAVLPGMRHRRQGVVVNVSSDSGRAPSPHEAAYGATKAALSAFTESMAFDVESSGVRLHVLYPGWVPTAMGTRAIEAGMPLPPRSVRRSEEQVSKLLLSNIGKAKVDIDATKIARFAPVARSLVPGLYRRGVRRAYG
jgi:short-subunit dehydrogenase